MLVHSLMVENNSTACIFLVFFVDENNSDSRFIFCIVRIILAPSVLFSWLK